MFVYCRITYLDLWRMQREVYLHWQMTGCNIKLQILNLHFYFLQSVIMKIIFFCCLSGQVFREIETSFYTHPHITVLSEIWRKIGKLLETSMRPTFTSAAYWHNSWHNNAWKCMQSLLIRFGSYTFKHYKSALLWFTIS